MNYFRQFKMILIFTVILTALVITGVQSRQMDSGGVRNISPSLLFEKNMGQTHKKTEFLTRGRGYTLLFQSEGMILMLTCRDNNEHPNSSGGSDEILKIGFKGAKTGAKVQGLDKTDARISYIKGNNRDKWITGIPSYNRINIENLYNGIDLTSYGSQGLLEYDFIVSAGADPDKIIMSFTGQQKLTLDRTGNLRIHMKEGILTKSKPVIYQVEKGGRKQIEGAFRLINSTDVGFTVGSYNKQIPLVIDPVLKYSTYIGGSGNDSGNGVTVDGKGNIILVGDTRSVDFPVVSALFPYIKGEDDIFVSKFSNDGSQLLRSTYIGGSGKDGAITVSVDGEDNIYITGLTESTDFPLKNPIFTENSGGSDAFVLSLRSDCGCMLFSTYMGGSGNDVGEGIAVDDKGNIYVSGYTGSEDFPTLNPLQEYGGEDLPDAFMLKISGDQHRLVYSTFIGGAGSDIARCIDIDPEGGAYMAGYTDSADFPVKNPLQGTKNGDFDAFVTKLNPDGSLGYSTYLGGALEDRAYGIAVDNAGSAYVTGRTFSGDFPLEKPLQAVNAGEGDIFVTKLSTEGNSMIYSTFFGGAGFDMAVDSEVDHENSLYVTGYSRSQDFPTVKPLSSTNKGEDDIVVLKINPAGDKVCYSTYMGGSGIDYGFRIAVDSEKTAYVAGHTGSTDFPTEDPLFNDNAGEGDAVLIKIAYGLNLASPETEKSGDPGYPLIFDISVTNNDNEGDSVDISAESENFDVNIYKEDRYQVLETLNLKEGETLNLTVKVMLPAEEIDGASDRIVIKASSMSDPTKNSEIILTASANNVRTQGSNNCFIATAAFGSYQDPHVLVLRRFRDDFLLTSSPGRLLVDGYYRFSPPAAALISENNTLKALVRTSLLPAYAFAHMMLNANRENMSILFLASLILFFVMKSRRKNGSKEKVGS